MPRIMVTYGFVVDTDKFSDLDREQMGGRDNREFAAAVVKSLVAENSSDDVDEMVFVAAVELPSVPNAPAPL